MSENVDCGFVRLNNDVKLYWYSDIFQICNPLEFGFKQIWQSALYFEIQETGGVLGFRSPIIQ